MVCAVLFRSNPETVGTLYSVDPRTWDRGPGDLGIQDDPGPMDQRTLDSNWHTLYMYVHSTCISNHSTGMHCGMEYEILCTVDGIYVPLF